MKILAVLTALRACLRLFGLVAFALGVAPVSAPAQDAHGAIAFGQTAYGESVAYGFAWNYSAKGEAIDAAVNACRAGGGTTCEELAWFRNGCGALALDQHGGPQGKSAMSQAQAEARAMRSCEAAGGAGCTVVGSQCAGPGGQAGTWSGSERVLAASETETATREAELLTRATQAREEALTRAQRIHVQRGLASLGFEAGPADGVFGPRTRAAIRDWQDAKGLDATGYLGMTEAEALAAVGMEAADATLDRGRSAGQPAASAAIAQESAIETTVQWIARHITRNACKGRKRGGSIVRYSAYASGTTLFLTYTVDSTASDRYCHTNCIREEKREVDFRNVFRSTLYSVFNDNWVEISGYHKYTVVRVSETSDESLGTSEEEYFNIPFCGSSAQANAAELDRAIQRIIGFTGKKEE